MEFGFRISQRKEQSVGNQVLDYIDQLHKQEAQLQNKMTRLIEMRANSELTLEKFIPQKELIVQELARVRNLIKDNGDISENWLEPIIKGSKSIFSFKKPHDALLKAEYCYDGQALKREDKKIILIFPIF